MSRRPWVLATLLVILAAGSTVEAQHQHRHGQQHQGMGMGMGSGCYMMGMARDSATMAQMQAIHQLVINHDRITRKVTNLPNGIRTVTESDDPELKQLLQGHVLQMLERIRAGDDPGLRMESPAVQLLFREREKIRTNVKLTDKGIRIEQTSADTAVVAALQKHAAEVTDLVTRGRVAMHEAMMMRRQQMGDCPRRH
jgi:hypothetical protein